MGKLDKAKEVVDEFEQRVENVSAALIQVRVETERGLLVQRRVQKAMVRRIWEYSGTCSVSRVDGSEWERRGDAAEKTLGVDQRDADESCTISNGVANC